MGEPAASTERRPGEADLDTRCHWLLLRLSGLVSDELLTRARAWLAQGRRVDVAAAVVQAAVPVDLALNAADVRLLDELYTAADLDARAVGSVRIGRPNRSGEAARGFRFSAGPPAAAGEEPLAEQDDVLGALLADVVTMPSVRGVWLAWRSAANGAPWPPTRRVFVVETDDDADLPAVTARAQRVLAGAGEAAPQVETYPTAAEPPSRTEQARTRGALVYVRGPRPEIQFAQFFDEVDESGPQIGPDHPRLADPERVHVLNYLSDGKVLASTTARAVDRLRPQDGPIVPVTIRTDGVWIWNDASWYYLEKYHLAPHPGLLATIRARGYVCARVDAVALRLATMRLFP
ncbi:hypothetical protein ND748_11825 [Frankia sp. AiPs1]|uniref:hypothetical protein n=1 Tax=Frankia sp. AiPs1 TaxID=573493 RepID=UPI0020431D79|nr:hypothetical protein [Frankia sp. AiPs1]MCM3922344.1 hypothetical protein [Frankia sp. AiPs1]